MKFMNLFDSGVIQDSKMALFYIVACQAASFALFSPPPSAFLSQFVKLFALPHEYMLLIQTLFTSVTNQSVTTLPLYVLSSIFFPALTCYPIHTLSSL